MKKSVTESTTPAKSASAEGRRYWLWNIVGSLLLLMLLELGLYACLRFPILTQALPDSLKMAISLIYHNQDRITLQDYAQWHPLVTYTIPPSSAHRVVGHEFNFEVRGNSLGLRDDEDSLTAPEIVVLGDSFAMGFGVQAEQTFASLLEAADHRKVLNTGLESYGTARQVLTFNRRIDRSQVRWLVVQYCENDLRENLSSLAHGGDLPILSRERFQARVEHSRNSRRYRPFKYLQHTAHSLGADPKRVQPSRRVTDLQLELLHVLHARSFLKVLSELDLPEPAPRLIALDLWDPADIQYLRRASFRRGLIFDSRLFMQAVRQELREGQYPDFLNSMLLLDTSAFLEPDDRFHLDGHLRASGHAKIAERLKHLIDGGAAAEIPELKFLSTAADRQGQLQTEALPMETLAAELSCPENLTFEPQDRELTVTVTVHNQSPIWWPAHSAVPGFGPIRLRSHLLDAQGNTIDRHFPAWADLPRAVAPGERLKIPIPVPIQPLPNDGAYLELDLFQKGVGWLADHGGKPCLIHLKKRSG